MRALTEHKNTENTSQFWGCLPFLNATFVFVMCFLMAMLQPVQAQNSVNLSPEFTLNYANGQVDMNAGIIDVVNAELLYEGEVQFNAHTLIAKFDKMSEPENPTLKMLDISGLSVEHDDADISIGQITFINLPLTFDYPLSGQSEPDEIIAYLNRQHDSHYKLADLEINLKEADILVSIDEIDAFGERIKPLTDKMAGVKSSYEISNLSITRYDKDSDAQRLNEMLAQLGLNSIRQDIIGGNESRYQDRRVSMRSHQNFDLSQLVRFSWDLEISLGHSIFDLGAFFVNHINIHELSENDDLDDFDLPEEELRNLLLASMGEILVHGASVELEDKGVMAVMPEPDMLVQMMEDSFQNLPEPIADLLRQPVTDFIYHGGVLAVDANPQTPANLLQLGTIMIAPEVAIQSLGLAVRHQKN